MKVHLETILFTYSIHDGPSVREISAGLLSASVFFEFISSYFFFSAVGLNIRPRPEQPCVLFFSFLFVLPTRS